MAGSVAGDRARRRAGWVGEEEEAKGKQGRVSGEGQEWGIGGYMGDKKDTQWRWVSQHCCKSSAGPCKLSDKLRVLKACSERAAHTHTHTHCACIIVWKEKFTLATSVMARCCVLWLSIPM